jgi:iron complex transport system ATP-binding protein
MLISFQKVTFSYQPLHKRLLHNLSFGIDQGSVTAILGPNGVGKTTLLYITLGWLKPQEGEIFLDNRPLHNFSQRERGRWMSLVPQKEYIPFEYSLTEYVMLGRAPYLKPLEMPGKEDYRIAIDSLEAVGLKNIRDKSITALSGGERQLLLMARALAQQPQILLLDEPTSHLDLKNKKRIISILKDQVVRGVTVLLTTHEPEVASFLADKLVLMREGQVLTEGPADEVLTGDLLSETYGLKVRIVEIEGKRVALWI